MNTKTLESIMRQEPLLMGDISRAFFDKESFESAKNASLFFGVGLCTSKEQATAIPFDILSFFFMAEKLRRELALDNVFVLIGDNHAETNAFMTKDIVRKLRSHMFTTFTTLIRNLHLTAFQIILGSTLMAEPTFESLLSKLPPMSNEYVRMEIADLTWFTKKKNVRLKLGWTINNQQVPQGHDERFFDQHIRDTAHLPLSFLHVKAGRTFDIRRPKASPYICVKNENRIVLSPNEHVGLKMEHMKNITPLDVFRGVRSHMALIVRLFESLFIRIPKQTLEEKVQFIIDLSTHNYISMI